MADEWDISVLNNSFIASVWSGWTIAGTGDFNGDRRLDILWRDNTGDVSIWLMEGTTVLRVQIHGKCRGSEGAIKIGNKRCRRRCLYDVVHMR